MNILIIKLGAIGDVLRTTAILPGLKEKYNGCKIDWVTKENAFDLIKNNKLIDEIFILNNEINKKYDLIINLDEELEACKLASETGSDKFVGAYLKDGKQVYTDDSSEWFDMGLISRFGKEKADSLKKVNKKTYQDIIFDILELDKKNNRIELKLEQKELKFAQKFKEKNHIDGLIIGLNTGAGKRWGLKKLSTKRTIELANKINQKFKSKIILFGGPEEKERNEKIKKSVNFSIIDVGCNNSLLEFAALLDLCDLVVCSDSLVLHIAAALGKNIVAFFTITSAAEIDLYGKGRKIETKNEKYGCSYVKGLDDKVDSLDLVDVGDIITAITELV